jgi:hypothetical protein
METPIMSFATSFANGLAPASNTFEVGKYKYMSVKMNCFQQFHVLRKLGPLLARIGPSFLMAPAPTTQDDGVPSDIIAEMTRIEAMGPALEALSTMSEDDCNYVLEHCLSVTKRFQEPNAWITVFNMQARRLQFEDIDLGTMIQITIKVLGDNLANFSLGGDQSFAAPSSTQKDPSNTSPLPTVKIT